MRFFDDFAVGQTLPLAPYTLSRDELIAFAAEFDPQPFHLDEAAGSRTLLGGLSASGWHTCAIFMRMMCDGWLNQSASMGSPGIEKVKWLHPVRAGDRLGGMSEVLEMRVSSSRPEMGIVSFRHTVENEAGKAVMQMVNPIMFGRRPDAAP
jgi:acyl dehydratase